MLLKPEIRCGSKNQRNTKSLILNEDEHVRLNPVGLNLSFTVTSLVP